MFDASLCPGDALRQLTDLRRRLVSLHLDELRQLGFGPDAELLFVNGFARPDWGLADGLGEEAEKLVRAIFDLAHDVERAEDELEMRGRGH